MKKKSRLMKKRPRKKAKTEDLYNMYIYIYIYIYTFIHIYIYTYIGL